MMVLVIGGSGSGKSAYAEKCTDFLSGEISTSEKLSAESIAQETDFGRAKKYYLATMQAFDSESQKKIARHRRLRAGKGFLTIEQPTGIQNAARQMEAGPKTALLECIANLTANEMFTKDGAREEEAVAEDIVREISILKKELAHFVIVSSNVFEDGRSYDNTTMAYIRAMGLINERLCAMADAVVEVVAGIPVPLKGALDRIV